MKTNDPTTPTGFNLSLRQSVTLGPTYAPNPFCARQDYVMDIHIDYAGFTVEAAYIVAVGAPGVRSAPPGAGSIAVDDALRAPYQQFGITALDQPLDNPTRCFLVAG